MSKSETPHVTNCRAALAANTVLRDLNRDPPRDPEYYRTAAAKPGVSARDRKVMLAAAEALEARAKKEGEAAVAKVAEDAAKAAAASKARIVAALATAPRGPRTPAEAHAAYNALTDAAERADFRDEHAALLGLPLSL